MACKDDLCDIEDVVHNVPAQQKQIASSGDENISEIIPTPRRRSRRGQNQEAEKPIGYDIPGTQTVYLKTYGCSHNASDSEYMAGQLVAYGYG